MSSAPLRTCVGCRRTAPATDLVRFVLDGSALRADRSGTAAGRGAWLHPDPRCVELARRRAGFARSFRRKVDDSALAQLLD